MKKVKPKNPEKFLDYSGFYGMSLPEYFFLVEERDVDKGGISWKVADPRLKKGEFMREQWFNSTHFEEVK
jgi:hypothetical protein